MTDELKNRGQQLFLEALDIPADERDSWIIQQCRGDNDLLNEVRSLLLHDALADDPLERGLQPSLLSGVGVSRLQNSGVQIRCPHCHNPIELVDNRRFDDVVCDSCGSSLSLVGTEETKTHFAEENNQIAHFRLLSAVGCGAFGTVFRAKDTKLDRTVAVKIPRQGRLDVADSEKFLREARAAAQLRHPNIVSVHEVGRENETLYIVSDFVEGVTLFDWLTGRQPTANEAARLCITIAAALHHAHQSGVIHRDLKPSNIMLDQSGQPHLMDFGLAKREAGEITMTLDGQVLGTPAYMSPEQARGEGFSVDRRTDIYSLGVILYELLTGERPFRGNTRMLLHQLLTEEARSPRQYNASIPRDLETICLKCLEKEPGRRYATAKEFADDLRRFVAGKAVLARPIGRVARAWRWCRRNPSVAMLTAGIAATLYAGIGVATFFALNADDERANAIKLAEQKDQLAREKSELAVKALASEKKARLQVAETEFARAYLSFEVGRNDLGVASFSRILGKLPEGSSEIEESARLSIAGWLPSVHQLERILSHRGFLRFAGFNSDASTVVAISNSSETGRGPEPDVIRFWNTNEGNALGEGVKLSAQVTKSSSSPMARISVKTDRIAVATKDAKVFLFNLKTGEPIGKPLMHPKRVSSMEFSSDGTLLVTACGDDSARIWNTETGELQRSLSHPRCRNVRFTADGQTLVTGRSKVRVWEIKTGIQRIPEIAVGEILDVNAAGTRLLSMVTRYEIRGKLRFRHRLTQLWDLRTGKEIGESRPYESGGHDFQPHFSPRGNYYFNVFPSNQANDSYRYSICSADDGKVVTQIKNPHAAYCVSFSPDDRLFTLGTLWGYAQMYDCKLGTSVGPPLEHDSQIMSLQFSANSALLMTTSLEGETKVWGTVEGTSVGQTLRHKQQRSNPAISMLGPRTSRILIQGPQGNLRLWRRGRHPSEGTRLGLRGHSRFVVSPDGTRAICYGNKVPAQLCDVATGQPIGKPFGEGGTGGFGFSPDGKVLIAGNGTEFRDAATGELLRPVLQKDKKQFVRGLSHDLSLAILARSNRYRKSKEIPELVIDDTKSGQPVRRFPDGVKWLNTTGQRHQTLSGKHELRRSQSSVQVWSIETGKPTSPEIRHPDVDGKTPRITAFRFLRGGQWILTIAADRSIRLWDTLTGRPIGQPITHETTVSTKYALNSDETQLATIAGETAFIWNLPSGDLIGRPIHHFARIHHITYSPDSRKILTCSDDKTVQLWDAETGKAIGRPMQHRFRIKAASFSPDGKLIQSIESGPRFGFVWIWHTATRRPVMPPVRQPYDVLNSEFALKNRRVISSSYPGGILMREIPTPESGSPDVVRQRISCCTALNLTDDRLYSPMTAPVWVATHQNSGETAKKRP